MLEASRCGDLDALKKAPIQVGGEPLTLMFCLKKTLEVVKPNFLTKNRLFFRVF